MSYKVPVRGDENVYFESLDAATRFCNDVAAKTGIILTIIECSTRPIPSNLRGHFPGEFFGSVLPIGKDRNKRYKATGEFRAPKRGEYYLSGAIIQAYRAPNDLSQEYWIAVLYELTPCPHCGQLQ
jgi:hypothetical protein